jgi:hypothetical protein
VSPEKRYNLNDDGLGIKKKAEIQAYMAMVVTQEQKKNPLLFWKANSSAFPHLATLAKEFLSLSSSSVPVECMFSTMGLLANGKRSRLSPFTLNAISFIHDNVSLFN